MIVRCRVLAPHEDRARLIMRVVLAILFGASLTIVTAWSLGAILLRKLSLALYRAEERLLAFLVGSALLSAIMFVLASLRSRAHPNPQPRLSLASPLGR